MNTLNIIWHNTILVSYERIEFEHQDHIKENDGHVFYVSVLKKCQQSGHKDKVFCKSVACVMELWRSLQLRASKYGNGRR